MPVRGKSDINAEAPGVSESNAEKFAICVAKCKVSVIIDLCINESGNDCTSVALVLILQYESYVLRKFCRK